MLSEALTNVFFWPKMYFFTCKAQYFPTKVYVLIFSTITIISVAYNYSDARLLYLQNGNFRRRKTFYILSVEFGAFYRSIYHEMGPIFMTQCKVKPAKFTLSKTVKI